ncbi:MAG: protein YgfX [Gammaproteobacteria bacterium]
MQPIELKPSRLLGLLLGAMSVLALGAIYLAALPFAAQGVLAVSVVGALAHGWKRLQAPACLRIEAAGTLQCRAGQDEWTPLEVLGDSLVTRYLIVLRYRRPGTRARTQVLMADSASADDLRRLRVSLRWARHTRSDTRSPGAD